MQRHPLDLFSLLAGAVLTAIAILSLTTGFDLDLLGSQAFWPVVLIGLGLIVLAGTLGPGRRDVDPDDATETSDPVES